VHARLDDIGLDGRVPPDRNLSTCGLRLVAGLLLISVFLGVACRPLTSTQDTTGSVQLNADCPTAGDEAITSLLRTIRNQRDLPAMAAAVVTSDGLQFVGAVGVRKRGTGVAVGLDDRWHLGSDTKAMTALLVARLVERGQLSWDTTPEETFPNLAAEFHAGFKSVTILHLLCHRAGVQANLNWAGLAHAGAVGEQRIEAVRQALAQEPLHPPGSAYLYSNLGYVLVGAMIEKVLGTTWEQAMQAEVFTPLNMSTASFGGLGTKGLIDQPWGHLAGGQAVKINGPAADNLPVLGPAGTVHCTIQDWAQFVADCLRGARGRPALLKPASYEVLFRTPFGGDYALGWLVTERPWGGGLVLNHCGCNTMYYANAWLAPKRDFAILVCCNQGLDAFEATDQAVGKLIEWYPTAKRGRERSP
jgi:CubicO group peptidase (beta-lactamase class C family)